MQTEDSDSSEGNVLVVDDDPAVGKVLSAQLAQAQIACRHVPDAPAALALLREQPVDVVITDLRMPGPSGMELLAEIGERWPDIPVILLTAHGNINIAVEAMKKGAADFLLKPFDREEILFTVRKQLAAARHRDQPSAASEAKAEAVATSSAEMREVHDLIRRAASSTATVLIRGESGTGKELAARAIHDSGPRKNAPFVKIQCAALPDTLIESELFGYEKGAFTGAASRKPGRVELAEGGTLFLDEIGDVSPVIQVKLLRLLQDREFERLGGNQTLKSTARILAATHQPLEELIKKHTFREDLFYRLNVLPIWIPALRARAGDIEALAHDFCKQFGAANGRGSIELAPEAIALLKKQPWPGNVRELQNVIERAVVFARGNVLDVDALPDLSSSASPLPATQAANDGPPPRTIAEVERSYVEQVLLETRWVIEGERGAARRLGLHPNTLRSRLKRWGVMRPNGAN
jgi:two-component system response regulator AtoC